MNRNKVGLVVGSFVAFVHFIWGIAMVFGFAQPWINFLFHLHSLNNPFTVMPFDLMLSISLIIVNFLVGYVLGYLFAIIWNKVHK